MSGISGILSLKGGRPDPADLAKLVDALAHRGTSAPVLAIDGACGLGVSRYASEGTSAANSPLHINHPVPYVHEASEIDAWIVSDGEFYNHLEIRAALKAMGAEFTSEAGEETLLHAYLKFGAKSFIKAFRGMFAFAIWDATRKQLILARDRFGQKPLYYTITGDSLIFASEIRSLLVHPGVTPRFNDNALAYYLTFGSAPHPETMFKDIFTLPAGYMLQVDVGSPDPLFNVVAYWPQLASVAAADPRSEQDIACDLLAHLRGAARLNLKNVEAPVVLLNGDLDSAAMLAVLAGESAAPLSAIYPSFAGEDDFEAQRITRAVAGHFMVEHHRISLEPDVIAMLGDIHRMHDQPHGHPLAVRDYLLSTRIQGGRHTIFESRGARTLFAGHDSFQQAYRVKDYERLPEVAHRAIDGVLERLPEDMRHRRIVKQSADITKAANLALPGRYLKWVRLMPSAWLSALMGVARESAVREKLAGHFQRPDAVDVEDVVAQMLDLDLKIFLPEVLLPPLDQNYMGHGMEVRLPYLDHQFVNFVTAVPSGLKLQRRQPMAILRQAMKDILPVSIINQKLTSQSVPVQQWLMKDLAGFARDTMLGDTSFCRQVFNPYVLGEMLDIHMGGRVDLSNALWPVLMLELWAREYLN